VTDFVCFSLLAKSIWKSTFLHALHVVGSGVANNLNDASYLPHLTQSFLVLDSTSCNLTEGSLRRNSTFAASIQRVRLRPRITSTCKRPLKVKQCTWKCKMSDLYHLTHHRPFYTCGKDTLRAHSDILLLQHYFNSLFQQFRSLPYASSTGSWRNMRSTLE